VSDASFRHFLDTLKATVSIEDVVAARVPGLKRAGAEWKACCPFHEERTPSFHVVPDKGFFHCFGCHASGDAIGFLQKFDGVEFMEAVEELASSVGLEVPKKRGGRGANGREERMLEALVRAERLYQRLFAGAQGEAARAYLDERGLGREVVEAFGIGWAPASGHAIVDAASRSGFDRGALLESGLVKRDADKDRLYDFFRGRLIVPIRDVRGRTIGFGGRVLPGTKGPKYLNTAETPLFHKGRTVFGLDLAHERARETRHVIVMEGYTDVMAAHQAGLRQAVAVLGTATTSDHSRVLRRTGAQRLTLVFDGDRAGRGAALKALRGVLARDDFDTVDVVALPEGRDPADLLTDPALVERARAAGAEAPDVAEVLGAPVDWFAFLVDGFDALGPKELTDAVDAALGVVAVLPNPVETEARVRELAAAAGLSESAVLARFEELVERDRRPLAPKAAPARAAVQRSAPANADAHANASAHPSEGHAPVEPPQDPAERHQELLAWADLLGACLVDNALVGLFRERLESAREGRGPRHPGLARVLELLCSVYEEDEERVEAGLDAAPIDVSRLTSAAAAEELDGDDDHLGHVFGATLGAASQDGADGGTPEGGASVRTAGEAAASVRVEEVTRIAVRLEQRGRSADDVRALAQGAAAALERVEKKRTTAETLAAAVRGEDPDVARLEAANRVFGLERATPHAANDPAPHTTTTR